MTTALTTLNAKRDHILQAVPEIVGHERFWNIATSVAASPNLNGCSPVSIVMAVYGCAKLGLVPDPALGHVYIIPRKLKDARVAQVQIGYRGYIELAMRSRRIAAVHAEVVYANDRFEVCKGTNRHIVHTEWDMLGHSNAGDLRAAYVTWLDLTSNTVEFHRIGRARVDRAKKSSQTVGKSFSPWKSDEPAMWRKTACIDASKLWPLTPELAMAVEFDRRADAGEPQVIVDDFQVIEQGAPAKETDPLDEYDSDSSDESGMDQNGLDAAIENWNPDDAVV